MDLVVLVSSWCFHEVLCSHLLIGVPLPKVTVIQYCHSVTAELLEKCSFDVLLAVYFFCFQKTHQNIILCNASS